MRDNYYSASGKKIGYTGKDIWGNKSFYGTDGKKKCTYGTDIWGNSCFYGTDGRKKGYKRKSWL